MDRFAVEAWLNSLDEISEVVPLVLTVKDEKFEGCSYTQEYTYTADMMAVQDGRFKAGDKYQRRAFYFIGPIPKCRKKRQSLCFIHNGEVLYLSSYFEKDEKNNYHPFGRCFMLGIWDEATIGPIDQYERSKYHRIPVTME